MIRRSLRARLLLAAAGSITLALAATGLALTTLFEHHVERRIEAQLDGVLSQILGHVAIGPDGRIHLDLHLGDPRFETPLGGLYWQIEDRGSHGLLRSRSLWDQVLDLPGDSLPNGVLHRHRLPGPAGQSLMVLERGVRLGTGEQGRPLRVSVALDRAELVAARQAFAADVLPYLLVLGTGLVAAAWLQVRLGLAPLGRLRGEVQAVRAGASARLSPDQPSEVGPLVDELNALLAGKEAAIERARSWTADLAHGLKTPLVVLAADAERLRGLGQAEIARDLDRLAQWMRRRVDRELIRGRVRARIAAATPDGDVQRPAGPVAPLVSDLGDALESLIHALGRTAKGEALDWDLDCPAGLAVAIAADDLAELLGNLLDNAVAWADSRVLVQARAGDPIELRIEDDGPGVPEEMLPMLGHRGLRLDERGEGSGLGLAIALDICDAYGGGLGFAAAGLGGLAVILRLPVRRS